LLLSRVRIPTRRDLSFCTCLSRLSGGIARYEVPLPRLPFLDRESVANVQGLASLPTVRLERKIGRLSVDVMARLKDTLAFALDLQKPSE